MITGAEIHPRHKNCFLYKKMAVAKGTAMYDAIERGDSKAAEKLYADLTRIVEHQRRNIS